MQRIGLALGFVVLVLLGVSGVAGVAAGEDSAAAGWWLIVVSLMLGLLAMWVLRRRGSGEGS